MARTVEQICQLTLGAQVMQIASLTAQTEQQAERLVQLEAELASLKAPKPDTETVRFRHSSMLKPD
jgi:cell division protein FtsB